MNVPQVYEQWRQTVRQEGQAIGEQRGRREGESALVVRLLARRVGTLSNSLQEIIEALALPDLEELGEALLDFETMDDLEAWLDAHCSD